MYCLQDKFNMKKSTRINFISLTFSCSFPSSRPEDYEKWVQTLKRKREDGETWRPNKHSKVCSVHFEPAFLKKRGSKVFVVPGAVPTIFNTPVSLTHSFFVYTLLKIS